MKTIESVTIVGMGALGLLYGSLIMDHLGEEAVTYVMNRTRYEKYQNQVFTCNGKEYRPRMAGCVGPRTVLVSVLNGISSEEVLAGRYEADYLS